jgi:hypothetical protein
LADDAHTVAAGEVGDGGRTIVAEHDHEDPLSALVLVIGIIAHEGAAVDEPGDVLVSRGAGDHDQI